MEYLALKRVIILLLLRDRRQALIDFQLIILIVRHIETCLVLRALRLTLLLLLAGQVNFFTKLAHLDFSVELFIDESKF